MGALSIEHKDETSSRKEEFIHAARYLNQFC